jgi:sugar phosphate isomerase/epimerase
MNRLFAMDTFLAQPNPGSPARYPRGIWCAMVAELGFHDAYHTCFTLKNPAEQMAWLTHAPAEHGLGIRAVYAVFDASPEKIDIAQAEIEAVVAAMPQGVDLELAILCNAPEGQTIEKSSPEPDALILPYLLKTADRLREQGGRLILYPHMSFWLERFEDAVRLARALNRPQQVGVAWCSIHWAVVEGRVFREPLEANFDLLMAVNLCGSVPQGKGQGTRITTLDEGTFDAFPVLALLRKLGYGGPIGFQGYSVQGDVYAKLAKSLNAYKDIIQRLDRHPEWAELNY